LRVGINGISSITITSGNWPGCTDTDLMLPIIGIDGPNGKRINDGEIKLTNSLGILDAVAMCQHEALESVTILPRLPAFICPTRDPIT
jgi:hypothetical protein